MLDHWVYCREQIKKEKVNMIQCDSCENAATTHCRVCDYTCCDSCATYHIKNFVDNESLEMERLNQNDIPATTRQEPSIKTDAN